MNILYDKMAAILQIDMLLNVGLISYCYVIYSGVHNTI